MTQTPLGPPGECADGSGGGAAGSDVEQNLLCDLDAEGNLLGTALAVYEYDENGNPVGAPTFVDPATGLPYVQQGLLQPCADTGCLAPVLFHTTTSQSGPVDHPGRQYDLTLPINPGFQVDSLQVDDTNHPANLFWTVFDPDGETFRQDLTTFIEGRLPADAVVTITNPNAGTVVCGLAVPMTIHIECLRIDQAPPNLVELVYNGGRDLVVNPAYLTTPPTDLSNVQFSYLRRQDAGGTINCTGAANRGWETNDLGPNGTRDFELWGTGPGGLQQQSNATPTPRGTPIQEVTADINDTGAGPTIWQTFQVPAAGNFRVQLVHGARDPGEQHTIRLSTGDTNDTGPGDIINDVTNPPSVTNSGGPNPWTTLDQTVPLGAGEYTFSFQTTTPVGDNRGGLFTDMRVYQDVPGQRATAEVDDDTCVVTTEETTTVCDDQYWAPRCVAGDVVSWRNVETGTELANAAFWGQAPAPIPGGCPGGASGGGGGSVAANLVHTYQVCAVVGGVPTTLQRVVITDGSGGVLADSFVGPDGGPVTAPTDYTVGSCQPAFRDVELVELCDLQANGGIVPFVREMLFDINGNLVSARNIDANGSVYVPTGQVTTCSAIGSVAEFVLCDEQIIPAGPPVERITNGNFVADASGWNIVGNANWTNNAGYLGPDGQPGILALNGGNLPANAVVSQSVSSGITPGDVFHLQARLGTKSTDSQSSGPIRVLVEVLDGGSNVLYSQQFVPTMSVGGVAIQWPPNGVVNVPGIVATDGTITVRFTDQSGPANLGGADGAVDAVSLMQQVSAGTTNVPFIRKLIQNAEGAVRSVVDLDLDGALYEVQGTVGTCPVELGELTVESEQIDTEILILCDANGTRFLRRYVYDAETPGVTVVNTTLDGSTPFAPVGAAVICTTPVATDFDFAIEQLCDNNGPFLRRFTFNSATGAVTTITNTTLAGANYAPVGTVGNCEQCCPQVVGEGCTNVGSGRYTAIRAVNGTISLIDSVTGAAVAPAAIVACAQEAVETVTAQHRLIGDADAAWTPGADVVGTLLSVTYTVLSGTADVTDQSGTVATGLPAGLTTTWSTEDDANTLSGPQSIDAVGGQTYVVWTQR